MSGGMLDLTPTANGVREHHEAKIKEHESVRARTGRAADGTQKTSDTVDNLNNGKKLADKVIKEGAPEATVEDISETTALAGGALKGHVKGAGKAAGIAQIVHGFNNITEAFQDKDGQPRSPEERRQMIMNGLSEGIQGLGEFVPGKRGQMMQAIGQNMVEIDNILANDKLSDAEKATQVAKVTGKVIGTAVVGVVGGDIVAGIEVIKNDYEKGQLGAGTALRVAEATAIGQGVKDIANSVSEIKKSTAETDKINADLQSQYSKTNVNQASLDKKSEVAEPDMTRDFKTLGSAAMMIPASKRGVPSENYEGLRNVNDPKFLREQLTELRDKAAKEAATHERPGFFKKAIFGYVEHQSQMDLRMYETALKELDIYEKEHKGYLALRSNNPNERQMYAQNHPELMKEHEQVKAQELAKSDKAQHAGQALASNNVQQKDVQHQQGHNAGDHRDQQAKAASNGRA